AGRIWNARTAASKFSTGAMSFSVAAAMKVPPTSTRPASVSQVNHVSFRGADMCRCELFVDELDDVVHRPWIDQAPIAEQKSRRGLDHLAGCHHHLLRNRLFDFR